MADKRVTIQLVDGEITFACAEEGVEKMVRDFSEGKWFALSPDSGALAVNPANVQFVKVEDAP